MGKSCRLMFLSFCIKSNIYYVTLRISPNYFLGKTRESNIIIKPVCISAIMTFKLSFRISHKMFMNMMVIDAITNNIRAALGIHAWV
jgi:hypothetical protein